MKKMLKKLQVRIETIRQLNDQELHSPIGGVRANSTTTDEMGFCNSCYSCWHCSQNMCPPPPPF